VTQERADVEIGSRTLAEMIEVCEHNNKKYLNVKKFEEGCKRHSVEEKTEIVFQWCKNMLKIWKKQNDELGDVYK
jgi:hypothetical protein